AVGVPGPDVGVGLGHEGVAGRAAEVDALDAAAEIEVLGPQLDFGAGPRVGDAGSGASGSPSGGGSDSMPGSAASVTPAKAAASRSDVMEIEEAPPASSRTSDAPSTRSIVPSPNTGVPNPPAAGRSPIRPVAALRAGASTWAARRCSASRLWAKPAGSGSRGERSEVVAAM